MITRKEKEEKIAQAIIDSFAHYDGDIPYKYKDLPWPESAKWRNAASAALRIMEAPDPECAYFAEGI